MPQVILTDISQSSLATLREESLELGITPGEFVNRLVELKHRLEFERAPETVALLVAAALLTT